MKETVWQFRDEEHTFNEREMKQFAVRLRFQLLIDSGNRDEPGNRYFGSLAAAKEAAASLDPKWHPFVWISEKFPDGGRRVWVADGKERSQKP